MVVSQRLDSPANKYPRRFWHEMGQSGGFTNGITALADSAAPTDIGNVRVLNLWVLDSTGTVATDVQSHLTIVPAPAALVLGALGLGLVGWVKRRLA